MHKPLKTYQRQIARAKPVSGEFSLLCWNVQKRSLTRPFHHYMEKLLMSRPSDIILLQEAKVTEDNHLGLAGYSYVLAPNIVTKKALYGVLSASRFTKVDQKGLLSLAREIAVATHKATLLTAYLDAEGNVLMVVNIHALNFMPVKAFENELERLRKELSHRDGPLIVAGDFNAWTPKREEAMHAFSDALGLTKAHVQNEEHIKTILGRKLDFIYYRGLTLIEAEAINAGSLSDHNPLYARFSL